MKLLEKLEFEYHKFITKYIIKPNKRPSISLFKFLKLKLILRPKKIINEIDIDKIPLPSKDYEFLKSILASYDSKIIKLDDILPKIRYAFFEYIIRKRKIIKQLESILVSRLHSNNWVVFYDKDMESIEKYKKDIGESLFKHTPTISLDYFLEIAKYKNKTPTNLKLYRHFKKIVYNFRIASRLRDFIYNYFNDTYGRPIYNIIEEDGRFLFKIWYDKQEFKKHNIKCAKCSNIFLENITRIEAEELGVFDYNECRICDECMEKEIQ